MNYIDDLRSKYGGLEGFTDNDLIMELPDIDPDRFGGGRSYDEVYQDATYDEMANMGDAKAGLLSGYHNLKAAGQGVKAVAGEALGAESWAKDGLEGYQRESEEAGKYGQGKITDISQINGIGDALDFVQFHGASGLVSTLPTLAGGGVGGIAAKKALTSYAANKIQEEIKKGVPEKVAAQAVASNIAVKGATAGAFGAADAQMSGLTFGNIYEETGQRELGKSLVSGAGQASLEIIPGMALLKKMGLGKVAEEGIAEIVDGIAPAVGKQIFSEGITEGSQNVIETATLKWVDNNRDILGEEGYHGILNAMAAGAAGGGTMGAGAHIIGGGPLRTKRIEQTPEQAADDARAKAAANGGDALDQEMGASNAFLDTQGRDLPGAKPSWELTPDNIYYDSQPDDLSQRMAAQGQELDEAPIDLRPSEGATGDGDIFDQGGQLVGRGTGLLGGNLLPEPAGQEGRLSEELATLRNRLSNTSEGQAASLEAARNSDPAQPRGGNEGSEVGSDLSKANDMVGSDAILGELGSSDKLANIDPASSLEGVADGVDADTKRLSNILRSDAVKKHGFGGLDAEGRRDVMTGMVGARHNPQVRDAIIELLPVDVMNYLGTNQLSPKVLFHDDAVLKDLLAVNSDNGIPAGVGGSGSLVLAGTSSGAVENPGTAISDLARKPEQVAAASGAVDSDLPSSLGDSEALARAEQLTADTLGGSGVRSEEAATTDRAGERAQDEPPNNENIRVHDRPSRELNATDKPEILTKTKAQYVKSMAKKAGVKKGSPGYADAMAVVSEQYEAELERAEFSLPFDEFAALPDNSSTSGEALREIYEQVRDELGIKSVIKTGDKKETVKAGLDEARAKKSEEEAKSAAKPLADITLTETVEIQETGESVELSQNAQQVYDTSMARGKMLRALLDCVKK